ncbi:MAG: citrate/2-methylcitrate synthase [Clostridiales bacterium]|nr:citrate/2-methylcitrate synthase [Clostridiales bacterium]
MGNEINQLEMDAILDKLGTIVEKNDKIDQDLYLRYNVKRGLRDQNGTGVLVGLTEIGDVRSYVMDEEEMVPTEGRLFYRGLEINDLVNGFQKEKRYGFEECCYLLLFGELPDKAQLEEFKSVLGEMRTLPAGFTEDMILKAPSNDIMNKLARSVLASYSFDENPDDISLKNTLRQCIRLIAQFPTMAAYGYQAKSHYHDGKSLYIHMPRKELSTSENLLHLIRPDSCYTASEAEILDLALVLHAEHGGGNNSTFVAHVVTSTGTDTYSAIAAAIGSLKGPQHGGANLKVMSMMEDIKQNVRNWNDDDEIAGYLGKIIRKEAYDHSGLIYGIGHAVYTKSDPRTILLKQKAEALAAEKGMEKEYDLYTRIERLAPDVFFQEKKNDKVMCANVDFYSGFVYQTLNIPVDLYTPIFAVGRVAGWCAHRIEELVNGGRIIRPAYKSVVSRMKYVPLDERG